MQRSSRTPPRNTTVEESRGAGGGSVWARAARALSHAGALQELSLLRSTTRCGHGPPLPPRYAQASPATTGQHSQNHPGVVRIVIDTKRKSLFQHEQTFGERYASDATTRDTLQASAYACKRCKEATQANKSRPTLRGKHRILENLLANWTTAVRGARRCRAQPSREQHSPRSKRREHAASLAAPCVPIRCTSLKAFRHATHEQRQPAPSLASIEASG